MTIYEMTILLVPLSSKAFPINIQDLIHSLKKIKFQDYVQIFKPYWKLVIWHVICILGAQEHKITSHGSISTTKSDVFQYYFKFSYLVIEGKNLISSLILSSSLLYKTSYDIAIPHFFVMQLAYYTSFSLTQIVFIFFVDYLLIFRFWIVVLLHYLPHFMVHN